MASGPVSNLPVPENDYLVNGDMYLSEAFFLALLSNPGGVGPRLRALEAQRVEVQAVIEELRLFGLQRLDESLNPIITDTITRLEQLVADIAEAQAAVDELLAGNVPAAQVVESASRVFVSAEQRTEIGQLRTDLAASSSNLGAQVRSAHAHARAFR